MPTGWLQRGQEFENEGAALQLDAVEMRGRSRVNPSLFQLITDWNGGVDKVTITPTWAGELSNVQEIAQGWQGRIANNNIVQLLDLQGTKFSDHLGEFAGNGPKILQWMPVNQIADRGDGWWVAEEFILGGAWDNFKWCLQDDPDAPDILRGPNVFHSLAPYHKTKKNNKIGGDCHRVGKRDHWNNPLAVFWDAFKSGYKGHVVGRLVKVGDRVFKIFPMSEMAPYIAASNFVSVDATIGYTTQGAAFVFSSRTNYTVDAGNFALGNAGTIDSYSMYGFVQSAAVFGIYENGTNLTATLKTNGAGSMASGGFAWLTGTYSDPKPTLTGGETSILAAAWLNAAGSNRIAYDNGGSATVYQGSTQRGAAPSDLTGESYSGSFGSKFVSAYFTYTEAAGGIIPQIDHHRRMMRQR